MTLMSQADESCNVNLSEVVLSTEFELFDVRSLVSRPPSAEPDPEPDPKFLDELRDVFRRSRFLDELRLNDYGPEEKLSRQGFTPGDIREKYWLQQKQLIYLDSLRTPCSCPSTSPQVIDEAYSSISPSSAKRNPAPVKFLDNIPQGRCGTGSEEYISKNRSFCTSRRPRSLEPKEPRHDNSDLPDFSGKQKKRKLSEAADDLQLPPNPRDGLPSTPRIAQTKRMDRSLP